MHALSNHQNMSTPVPFDSALCLLRYLPVEILANIESFRVGYDPENPKHTWGCLASAGNVEGLAFLNRRNVPLDNIFFPIYSAVMNGHLNVLKWFHQNRKEKWTLDIIAVAAEYNQLEILKWVCEFRRKEAIENSKFYAIDLAAAKGHYEVVKWLNENLDQGCSEDAIDSAAAGGHLNIIKYLWDYGDGGAVFAMDNAAAAGHYDVVAWLHFFTNVEPTDLAMGEAAVNGHMKIVQFLHRYRDEGCDQESLYLVARAGNFVMLQWFKKNRPDDYYKLLNSGKLF